MSRSGRSVSMGTSLVRSLEHALSRLVTIWDNLGIMEEQRIERMHTANKHIQELVNRMVEEEENLEKRIRTNIVTFQQQMEAISLELAVEPYKPEAGMSVLQTERELRVRTEALNQEKTERLLELSTLRKQDEELCVVLCSTPYYIPTGSTPSHTQLRQLREHIATLREEKARRVGVFSGLRQEIRGLMEEMGHEPESSLERESVAGDPDNFLLTTSNITTLQVLLTTLEGKKGSLVQTLALQQERAVCLWSRLDVAEQERTSFQDSLHGTLADRITQWDSELARLTEQQRVRLEEVVVKIRVELLSMWDLCTFSPEQRQPFSTHFTSSEFSEELLALHDEELLRVQGHYATAKPLLELLQRWDKTWAAFLESEKKANDPNRFSNRGGALLKTAKEKAKLQKMLPKLEEELRSGVAAWEQNQGSDFLVWGQKVMAYIASQREGHKLQKDKTPKNGETTTLKTPIKRPYGGPTGPSPCKIRKTPNQQSPFPLQTPTRTFMRSHSTSTCSSSSGSGSGSSSSSSISTSSSKPPLPSRKARPVEGASGSLRPPLQEYNIEPRPGSFFSYSDFTSELSKKSHSDVILNSTVKDQL